MAGLSIRTCNPELQLSNSKILPSDIDRFAIFVNKLKKDNPNLIILSRLEASFDPMKESFLGDMLQKSF